MSHLVEFLKINELSQKEIADFWGVTESYVSRLCNDYQKLPKKRKNQLLGNSFGWDVSPLLKGTTILSNNSNNITTKAQGGRTASVNINNSNFNNGNVEELAALRKENEMLRERLADKDAQIDFLKKLLTK